MQIITWRIETGFNCGKRGRHSHFESVCWIKYKKQASNSEARRNSGPEMKMLQKGRTIILKMLIHYLQLTK